MTSIISHTEEPTILPDSLQRRVLPEDAMARLQAGLATCRSGHALTLEARDSIVAVCAGARRDAWTPEQLVIAVKDACYTSPEISHLTPTSERDAFLAMVITVCIQEFYRDE